MRKIALFGAAVSVLAGASLAIARPTAVPAGSRYVAMGSSFAAGPWVGEPVLPETRCAQSSVNYAHLLAKTAALDLVDVTCTGARAAHIQQPWDELAPQMAALTPDTRLVTITAGGNDLNYVGSIGAMTCPRMPADRVKALYRDQGCPVLRLPQEADYLAVEQTMVQAVRAIRQRAPKARVVLVQYFNLFKGPANCVQTGLSDGERTQLVAVADHLARLTARVARQTGAEVLPVDRLSRDHGVCSDHPWVRGNVAVRSEQDGAYYHPNRAGMAAVATHLAARLGR